MQQALSLLGLKNIQQWLSVLSMAMLSKDKPQALIHTAMLRGRILEETMVVLKHPRASEGFLLGRLLHMVKAIELGNWQDVDSFCRENEVKSEDLMSVYTLALKWVDEYTNSLMDT